ncbi:ankyrin repeat and SOCS box protein 14 [Leptonychotes weddellii]|uniref:Ankyrin repeat and SOCS box protein 14 n=1 Tax=Leptonychotes weddellii TaxID=9713 RepID=A0A7F8R474_LEPWE|nr:ankyrin repeat and SOCS box protein 14 [Leptonychotes weddellii]
MDNYTSDEDTEEDFDTQLIIQQSLQDIHQLRTTQQASADESFHSFLSSDYKKIIETIEAGDALSHLTKHHSAFDEADAIGWLPLHKAAVQLNKDILEITLKASKPSMWEQTTHNGETPLFLAVSTCLLENAHFLLLSGCNPNAKNSEGNSPLLTEHTPNFSKSCHFSGFKCYPLKEALPFPSTLSKFCEVITLSWLQHLSGEVVRVMLDYVDQVRICSKLKAVLQKQGLWSEIHLILTNPRPLRHLCRLKIRQCMGRLRLRCPVFMSFLPLPNRLKAYVLYKEYDLYGQGIFTGTW